MKNKTCNICGCSINMSSKEYLDMKSGFTFHKKSSEGHYGYILSSQRKVDICPICWKKFCNLINNIGD